VDDEADRRIGAIEVKQRLRDARCAACRSRSRKDQRKMAFMAVMAVVLMLVCVALAAVTLDASRLRDYFNFPDKSSADGL